MFGLELVLGQGQTIEEFARADRTSLNDVQFGVFHTILYAVDPAGGNLLVIGFR